MVLPFFTRLAISRDAFLFGGFLSRILTLSFFLLCGAGLLALAIYPAFDIAVSRLFATGDGFWLKANPFLTGMTQFVFTFSRFLALLFLGAMLWAFVRKAPVFGMFGKPWLFLLLALLIGPGLFANVVFKDHWGRPRPRDTETFGGKHAFTPAFVMSESCPRNCSFVSGDGSFGFFLPSFAYVVPRRLSRRVFWGGMAAGGVFSISRILLGAHFLSDVLAAMFLTLAVSASLFRLMFGGDALRERWRDWGFLSPAK